MRALPLPFILVILLFVSCQRDVSQPLTLDNMTHEEIAELFFPIFIEGTKMNALRSFEMSDAIRSSIGTMGHGVAIGNFQLQHGGVGELQKKETVQHLPTIKSVELFYSGRTNPFRARVAFEGNQIAGVYFFPWTGEQAPAGTPADESEPLALDNLTIEEIAELFFPIFIEGTKINALQSFDMSDAMRSFFGTEGHRAAIRNFQQQFGGVGELQRKENVQLTPTTRSAELFYSGGTNPFFARVTFEGNQIVGVHFFPWTPE